MITFNSEGVASGLSRQPQFGGKDLVSSSVSSPQGSILGVERCHLRFLDQCHFVFTTPADNHLPDPSPLLPHYCFTVIAGLRLFLPTLGCSFSEKHISISGKPPARKQATREMTGRLAATTISTHQAAPAGV
jgi:hypothetical protein